MRNSLCITLSAILLLAVGCTSKSNEWVLFGEAVDVHATSKCLDKLDIEYKISGKKIYMDKSDTEEAASFCS